MDFVVAKNYPFLKLRKEIQPQQLIITTAKIYWRPVSIQYYRKAFSGRRVHKQTVGGAFRTLSAYVFFLRY